MKPPPFRYIAARSLAETLALLDEHGEEAKVLAGGQSLMPLLNMRLARPGVLVDINRVRGLAYIRRRGDVLAMGATTRQQAVERSTTVRRKVPLLWEAVRFIGHPQIRSRGTIGGSVAHADPSAELPAVLAALDGRVVIRGSAGERVVRWQDFFTGYLSTALRPNELLTEVWFMVPPRATGTAFMEVARRHGDFALVGVAASLRREDGRIRDARLAFAGVGPAPVRVSYAEAVLRDGLPGDETFREAARAAAAFLTPDSDIHATAAYRREAAEVLARRALHLAWLRTRPPLPERQRRMRTKRVGGGLR